MESRSWKIFACCLLCAGIGTLISLKINHYFWWIGVMAGGFLGYLSYDFKKVIIAVPKAWNMARGYKIDWRKLYTDTNTATKIIVHFIISLIGFSFNFSIPLIILTYSIRGYEGSRTVSDLAFFTITISVCVLLCKGFLFAHECKLSEKFLMKGNFFRVYFYLLPKGIFWSAKKTPYALMSTIKGIINGSIILAKFAKNLFIIVHSEWRLLCATDSAIGVLVGYIYDNIFIGAIAGGVIGLLNYEIVSKRLLKLVSVNGHK